MSSQQPTRRPHNDINIVFLKFSILVRPPLQGISFSKLRQIYVKIEFSVLEIWDSVFNTVFQGYLIIKHFQWQHEFQLRLKLASIFVSTETQKNINNINICNVNKT